MRQTGKCLSLLLLFVSSAFAQTPRIVPSPPAPPYNFTPPSIVTPPSLPQVESQPTEIDIDSLELSEAWGNCLQADVWVLVDYSGSMSSFERFIAEGLARIAGGILGDRTDRRMGFISFDDYPVLRQGLTSDLQEAYASIKKFSLLATRSGTDINAGLLSVSTNHVIAPPNKNSKAPDFKKVLILISDGNPESESVEDILHTSQKMKDDGWWIYSIMATKSKITGSLDSNSFYNILKNISGNPNDPEDFYVDSILLSDLPEHFTQNFNCL